MDKNLYKTVELVVSSVINKCKKLKWTQKQSVKKPNWKNALFYHQTERTIILQTIINRNPLN